MMEVKSLSGVTIDTEVKSLFGVTIDTVVNALLSQEARKLFGQLEKAENNIARGEVTFFSKQLYFVARIEEMYSVMNSPAAVKIGTDRIRSRLPNNYYLAQSDIYRRFFEANIYWEARNTAGTIENDPPAFIIAGSLAEARYLAEEILGLKKWRYVSRIEEVKSWPRSEETSVYIYGTAKLRTDYLEVIAEIAARICNKEQVTDMTE